MLTLPHAAVVLDDLGVVEIGDGVDLCVHVGELRFAAGDGHLGDRDAPAAGLVYHY